MAWTEARETTREAIEDRLRSIGGDMLKIEYLENVLKQNQTFDVRKFAYVKVAELYEKRLMLNEAARNIDAAADISPTFKEKLEMYRRAIDLNIKHGSYDAADNAFKKCMTNTNSSEKEELRKYIKDLYIRRANELERLQKNNNAIKIYERLLPLSFVTEMEKQNINAKLMVLYRKVGRIVDSMRLGG